MFPSVCAAYQLWTTRGWSFRALFTMTGWLRHQEMQCARDVASDRAMRSVVVMVSTPILQLFASIFKAREPERDQAFGPGLAVERFGEPIVGRFSRL